MSLYGLRWWRFLPLQRNCDFPLARDYVVVAEGYFTAGFYRSRRTRRDNLSYNHIYPLNFPGILMSTENVPVAPVTGEKYRILLAEDEPSIGRLVVVNLNKAGFDCRHTLDGLEALREFDVFNPHLVLLDVMMPGMNGRDVCTRIREKSTVPIIMMTALDGEQDQLHGFKVGADDYIGKPFNPRLMVARIITTLRRVYRYDGAENVLPSATPTSSIPLGWATCDSCGFMGPREKFEEKSANGSTSLRCPFCKRNEFICFAL